MISRIYLLLSPFVPLTPPLLQTYLPIHGPIHSHRLNKEEEWLQQIQVSSSILPSLIFPPLLPLPTSISLTTHTLLN